MCPHSKYLTNVTVILSFPARQQIFPLSLIECIYYRPFRFKNKQEGVDFAFMSAGLEIGNYEHRDV